MRKLLGASALVATMMTTGCVVEVAFDPFGTDFAMEGSWTVNGAPPTVASCNAAGIDSVRVILWDAGTFFSYDELTFSCEQGSFATAQIFDWGSYETQWQALDDRGAVVGTGDRVVLSVFSPTTLATLAPTDFAGTTGGFDPFGDDFALSGTWTVNGAPPTPASCGAVTDVRVVLWNEDTFFPYDSLTFACGVGGSFTTDRIFEFGSYQSQWQAIDASGAVIADGERLPLIVTNQTMVGLAPVDFEIGPAAGLLTVQLEWEDKDGTAQPCALAGVNTMSYTLSTPGGGAVVAMDTDIACRAALSFEGLEFGSYEIFIEGAMSSGRKDWMVTCEGINHAAPGNAVACLVDYVGP